MLDRGQSMRPGWRRSVCRSLTGRTATTFLAAVVAGSLLVGIALPARAASGVRPYGDPHARSRSVAVGRGPTLKAKAKADTDAPGVTRLAAATLPTAASGVVAMESMAKVAGVRVSVSVAGTGQRDAHTPNEARGALTPDTPGSVTVAVLDQRAAKAAGVDGVLLAVSRADGSATASRAHLSVDYSTFRNAFGGDFGGRLRLVSLPGCVLTTPEIAACQRRGDLGSVNEVGTRRVSADVMVGGDSAGTGRAALSVSGLNVPSGASVVALVAGTSSSASNWQATSLSPASSWSAGNQGGSFGYSYPLRTPAGLGGPTPSLALGYDSGSVDARTLAQNGQSSWVGEGWGLEPGYIERSYRSCKDDGGVSPDLCWFTGSEVSMVFNGRSTKVVKDDATGVWHAVADSALKIEDLTGTSNWTYNGEYWRVTTQDGTQYYFGLGKRYAGDTQNTAATLPEPVFGNDPGEPCYNAAGFASSWCERGYRWNLDYVVDPRGNSMTYFYSVLVGHVGLDFNTNVQPYDFGSTLERIEYGTRAGTEAGVVAPMRVVFTHTGRCVNACAQNTSDYPDTPWDLYCTSTTSCPGLLSPVYWNPNKLSAVTTQVWTGSGTTYRNIDKWDLAYQYPSNGDQISPAGDDTPPDLWLNSITHTGYAADGNTTAAEPALALHGTRMANRVDWGNDVGVPPLNHYRLSSIDTGTGGETQISYGPTECTRAASAGYHPDHNPYRCFPQYFTLDPTHSGWGWFHKYTVASVTERDLTGGSPDEVWSYAYSTVGSSDTSLWHHDGSESALLAYRSWSDWRGYSTVTVTHGASGGAQTVTRSLYYRGMDGDGLDSADHSTVLWHRRRVSLTDSQPLDADLADQISGAGGKCVDVTGAVNTNGTKIEIFECNGTTAQRWQYHSDGTVRALGKCLDVVGSGTVNGTLIQLWDCTVGANQVWVPQANGGLKNPVSGRCLDLPNNDITNGVRLRLYDCNGAAGQTWTHVIADADGLQGVLREQTTLDDSTVVASTIHVPTVSSPAHRNAPVTGGGDVWTRMVNETSTRTRTQIAATGTWRWTRTDTAYDSYGLPIWESNRNDTSTSSDDVCTQVTYVRNITGTNYLVNYRLQDLEYDCAGNPSDGDYLAGRDYYYDGATSWGTAPTKGLLTQTDVMKTHIGGIGQMVMQSTTNYDSYGRAIASQDALGHTTTLSYQPTNGAPVTQTIVTNPMGWSMSTTVEPGHGVPTSVVDANGKVSTAQYDPLGRLTKVWLDDRPTTAIPNLQYTYMLSDTAANVTRTDELGPNGNQISSYQLLDGRLRARQTQVAGAADNGGRVISDTAYDGRGLVVKASVFWNASGAPSGSLVSFADKDVKNQHRYTYDTLARKTSDALWSGDGTSSVMAWQTTTSYDGDRVTIAPPSGGIASRALTDAQGRTVELDQFVGGVASGTYQATTYAYDRLGRQISVTDPGGNTWTSTYDMRGRVISKSDPDAGTSTMVYDAAGRLTSATDARAVTVSYTYDELGRKTSQWQGAVTTGTKLADWTFDTLAKGELTSAARHTAAGDYTTAVTGYDDAYRPLGSTVTIPASEGFGQTSFTTSRSYNDDGSVQTVTLPAAAGLGSETLWYDYWNDGLTSKLSSITTSTALADGVWYTPFGQLAEINLSDDGSKHVNYSFDEATGRLVDTWASTGDSDNPTSWIGVFDDHRAYTHAGTLTQTWYTGPDNTTSAQCYRYDGLQQLTQAWTVPGSGDCDSTPTASTVGGPDPYWQSYTFDQIGNRTTQTLHSISGGADTTYTYTYPTGHVQPHTLTSVSATGATTGTATYSYDPAGNTTTRQLPSQPAQSLTWTPDGHVASLTQNTATTSYTYDPDGNRLLARDSTGTTLYLGATEIHKNTTGVLSATRYYSAAGHTIATLTNPGALTYHITDAHGTTELTITNTNTTTRLRTDPYGNPRDTTPWPTTRGFLNKPTDPTGLTHLDAREYDPTLGRFISPDPIIDTTNPQQIGGYTYAANNPTTNTDPSGQRYCSDPVDCAGDPSKGNPHAGQGTTPASSTPPSQPWKTVTDPKGKADPRTPNNNAPYKSRNAANSWTDLYLMPRAEFYLGAAWAVADAACAAGQVFTCRLWRHWLNKSGSDYIVDPTDFVTDKAFVAYLAREAEFLGGRAVRACGSSRQCNVVVDSAWNELMASSTDLKNAIGHMEVRLIGKYVVRLLPNGKHEIVGTYSVSVYKDWNFDDGKLADRKGVDLGKTFGLLPGYGFAQNFAMRGTSDRFAYEEYGAY